MVVPFGGRSPALKGNASTTPPRVARTTSRASVISSCLRADSAAASVARAWLSCSMRVPLSNSLSAASASFAAPSEVSRAARRLVELGLADQSLLHELFRSRELPDIALGGGLGRFEARAGFGDRLLAGASFQLRQAMLRLCCSSIRLRKAGGGDAGVLLHQDLAEGHLIAFAYVERQDRLRLLRDDLDPIALQRADERRIHFVLRAGHQGERQHETRQ